MKKQIFSAKLFGSSVAVAVCLAWAGAASAYMDMTAMMEEGISYECVAPQKSYTVKHDNRVIQ